VLEKLPPVKEGSALVAAVKANDLDAVRTALESGEYPNQTQKSNFTSFQYACSFCSTEIVKVMLDAGGDVEKRETWLGRTPIMLATDGMNVDSVRLLIGAGADLTAVTPKGTSVLEFAKHRLALTQSDEKLKGEVGSAMEIVEMLKSAGAK